MANNLEKNLKTPESESRVETPEKKTEQPSEAAMLEGRINDARMRLETNEKGAKMDLDFATQASEQYPDFKPIYQEALKTVLEKRQENAKKIEEEMAEVKARLETLKKFEKPKVEKAPTLPEAQKEKTQEEVDKLSKEMKSTLPEEQPAMKEKELTPEAEAVTAETTEAEEPSPAETPETVEEEPKVAPPEKEEPESVEALNEEETSGKEQPSA